MGPEKWMDVDGVRTRYFEAGTGETLVLFHGSSMGHPAGLASKTWDLNFAPLARHLHVIAFDRLGQGFTDPPKCDSDYTLEASTEHAASFLRKLGKGPYHIAGHSRAGYVVTRLAMLYPDLVKTVTPIDTITLAPNGGRTTVLHTGLPSWDLRTELRAHYELFSWNRTNFTEADYDEFEAIVSQPKYQEMAAKMHKLNRTVFQPSLASNRKKIYRWLLAEGMPCPTLVVWANKDPSALIENGKLLVEMYMRRQPKTQFHLFNKSGHFVFREYPERFNRLMLGFIQSHS